MTSLCTTALQFSLLLAEECLVITGELRTLFHRKISEIQRDVAGKQSSQAQQQTSVRLHMNVTKAVEVGYALLPARPDCGFRHSQPPGSEHTPRLDAHHAFGVVDCRAQLDNVIASRMPSWIRPGSTNRFATRRLREHDMLMSNDHSTTDRRSRGNVQERSLREETRNARMRLHTAMIALCIIVLCSMSTRIGAQPDTSTGEYLLKSAFLFNFAKFVEWPDNTFATSTTPLMICVLGNDLFGSSLDAIADKTIKGRPLVIRRLRSINEVKDCQMLYVSPNRLAQTAEIVRTLQKAPILTVCDVEACAEEGVMLNMRMIENRVQLDMNLDAVQRTPLKVSSQLIKLTRIVRMSE